MPLQRKHGVLVRPFTATTQYQVILTILHFPRVSKGDGRGTIAIAKINLDIGHFTAAGYDPVDYPRKDAQTIVTSIAN